jgi:cytoskeletal protein CcmA (bactofilin family)
MVKNIPTIERSTKIRFGKNVPDSQSQEENTIIFNASNVDITTPFSNAVYLSPVRNRTDYTAPEVVLLMYDRKTKEITESGESANVLVGGSTFDAVVNRNNATSNTVQFVGPPNDVSFVASSNVGLSNLNPQHTVSVGSNLYIDDLGSNVLVVSGNVAVLKDMVIDGNLRVNGDTTVLYTENTSIKDALIELGRNNTSSDTTLDLGILMHRPDALSNVVIGYREGTDEFALAYTDAKPTDKTFTPKTDEDINVHVYGLTHVDANIYAHEDVLVTGNVYVSTNVSITEELTVSNNVYADKDLEVVGNVYVDGNVVAYKDFTLTGNAYVTGNVVASKDFTLTGNAYVSGNVNITNQLTVSDNAYVTGNVQVTEALIVSGNTHLEGDNVFVTHTMDFLDPTTAIITDQVSNVQIRLGQLENVSNLASNPIADQVLLYDGNQWMNTFPNHSFLTIKNAETTATMTSGNAVYISGYQNENLALVKLAKADSTATMPAIGVVYGDDILPDQEGLAVAYGKVNQMNTNGYQVGKTLYVSNVYAGYLTTVKPCDDQDANPDLIQNVGVVTRQNPTHGAMFVTGIGRANDIPNAALITDYNDMQYVYVNNQNNDLKKIASENLNIPLTTAVSSSSNSAANAVTLRGVSITSGDGFHGDLVVAGNVTVDSTTLHVDAETNRIGVGTINPGQLLDVRGAANVGVLTTTSGTVTDPTHSTSKDTGVLVVTQGGLGVEANIHSTNVFAARHIAVGTSATAYALDVRGTSNVGILTSPDITVTNGTDATNKTTGALNVSGGVGITKQLHAGNTTLDSVKPLNMSTGTIPYTDASKKLVDSLITQESDGTILISANVEIAGNISVLGNSFTITSNDLVISDRIIDIANNNVSHELDVGILMEHPGYNIGIIHHGTHPHHLSIGYTSNGYAEDHVEWNVPNHITANVWGHLITQNTVTIENNDMYIVNGGLGIGIGQRYDDNVPDSKLYVTGNTHITSNLYVGGSDTTANLFVDTTRRQVGIMTSSPEATLHVTGNAYVSSNLAVNGTDLYVDTVTNRVGIRTLSPGHNLDVRGTANVGTFTTTSGTVTDTTDATSTTTGALQVLGGLGVSKSIHAADTTFESVNITDSTNSTDKDTGALIVQSGGAGIELNLNVGGTGKIWDATDATTTTSGALQVVGGLGVAKTVFAADISSGSVDVTDTTTSDSTTSGALKVTGGMSTQENLNVGGTGKIWDATDATTTTSGALQVVGGLGVAKTVFAADVSSGSVDVTDATTSDSATTGALKVTGGMSTQENLNVGGTGKIWNATDATTTTSGALQVVGGLGVAKTVFAADMSSGSVDVTDATTSDSATTGALKVTGGMSTQENLNVGGTGKIWDATDATTTTSGALQVVGGLGVAKTVFAADLSSGSVIVTDDTASDSTTTGALTVAGGVGITRDLYAANVYITGGLIANTGGTRKKTYSHTGTLPDNATIGNATFTVVFTNHIFHAKITAILVEGTDTVSTLTQECCGGHITGGTPQNITLGMTTVIGHSACPWDTDVTADGTTVTFKAFEDVFGAGYYDIFVEYMSANSSGAVDKFTQGGVDAINFNY